MIPMLVEIFWAVLSIFYYSGKTLLGWVLPAHMRYKDISGKKVLLTGGGSGIGRLISCKLAEKGATIITWDINKAGNEETVKMIKNSGGSAYAYTVDLSSKDAIYAAADQVKSDIGPIDILVNNAGIVSGTPLLNTSDQKIVKTFEVNILAHFWTIKSFLPEMINQKYGHIVNVASLAGHSGTNKLVDYCSSKFAAVGLDEAMRIELLSQGHSDYIKTTVICPYYISTGMFAGVKSKLVPILEPEYVADTTVDGILSDKEEVLIPGWTCLLVALKSLVPTRASMKLGQACGFNCSMDQFTGRNKQA